MGCSSCGGGGGSQNTSPLRKSQNISIDDGEYTNELMVIWKDKLECIKRNGLFTELGITKYTINFALGTVQSVLNSGHSYKFKKQLDKIKLIILALINTGKCQNQ